MSLKKLSKKIYNFIVWEEESNKKDKIIEELELKIKNNTDKSKNELLLLLAIINIFESRGQSKFEEEIFNQIELLQKKTLEKNDKEKINPMIELGRLESVRHDKCQSNNNVHTLLLLGKVFVKLEEFNRACLILLSLNKTTIETLDFREKEELNKDIAFCYFKVENYKQAVVYYEKIFMNTAGWRELLYAYIAYFEIGDIQKVKYYKKLLTDNITIINKDNQLLISKAILTCQSNNDYELTNTLIETIPTILDTIQVTETNIDVIIEIFILLLLSPNSIPKNKIKKKLVEKIDVYYKSFDVAKFKNQSFEVRNPLVIYLENKIIYKFKSESIIDDEALNRLLELLKHHSNYIKKEFVAKVKYNIFLLLLHNMKQVIDSDKNYTTDNCQSRTFYLGEILKNKKNDVRFNINYFEYHFIGMVAFDRVRIKRLTSIKELKRNIEETNKLDDDDSKNTVEMLKKFKSDAEQQLKNAKEGSIECLGYIIPMVNLFSQEILTFICTDEYNLGKNRVDDVCDYILDLFVELNVQNFIGIANKIFNLLMQEEEKYNKIINCLFKGFKLSKSAKDNEHIFKFIYYTTKFKKILRVKDDDLKGYGHYTNIEQAKFFFDKNNDNIKIRLNNLVYVNDPSEGTFFMKEKREQSPMSYFSFSLTRKESLPMWVTYAGDGKGCFIKFNSESIKGITSYGKFIDYNQLNPVENNNFNNQVKKTNEANYSPLKINFTKILVEVDTIHAYRVLYVDKHKENYNIFNYFEGEYTKVELVETLKEIEKNATEIENKDSECYNDIVLPLLQEISDLIKSPEYAYEEEIRIIDKSTYNDTNVKLNHNDDLTAPKLYREYGDNGLIIDEVVFGPATIKQKEIQLKEYIKYCSPKTKFSNTKIKYWSVK